MRALGVDFGGKRIGIAVAEVEARVASPRAAISASGALRRDAALISEICKKEQAEIIVVGEPLGAEGEPTKMSKICRKLGDEIAQLGHEVRFVDESMTSVSAQRLTCGCKIGRRRSDADISIAKPLAESSRGFLMLRKAKRRVAQVGVLGVTVALGFVFSSLIAPMPVGPKQRFVMVKPRKLSEQLQIMADKGVIRSTIATSLYGMVVGFRGNRLIAPGVYEVHAGQSAGEVLRALVTPLRQLVRLPEGRWAARTAKTLAEKEVCTSAEYLELIGEPEKFKTPGVPLTGETLEGYLYPDTYNFPPDLGAELVIRRQLLNFAKKTKSLGLTEKNAHRVLTIASMLELESNKLDEKKLIAGVIENRIKKGMRLQIDATVNYGMQLWRPLFYKDYTSVKSPYNTYLKSGLPPGPICSPTVDSIKAALAPAQHDDLFYISLPDGRTLFSSTYEEHLKNVALRDRIKTEAKK